MTGINDGASASVHMPTITDENNILDKKRKPEEEKPEK